MIAYLLGVATPLVASAAFVAVVVGAERVGYRCRDCGWSTGCRAAAVAWPQRKWHVYVTRSLGRCRR